jgi:hypothetical protein
MSCVEMSCDEACAITANSRSIDRMGWGQYIIRYGTERGSTSTRCSRVSGRWVSDHVLRVLDGMIQDYWFCGSLEMEVLQISWLCLSGMADLMLRGVKSHD